jgi:hypothetical protein
MQGTETQYEDRKTLLVPVDAAWDILTCQAGARLWLADDTHPGVRIGAEFPIRDGHPAEITGFRRRSSIDLSFPSGRRVVISFRHVDERKCELAVCDDGGDGQAADALSGSWSALLHAAGFVVEQTKENRRGRQAVVMIHGTGARRPMSTIRSFTYALLGDDDRPWSKPDQMSAIYELRRYQLKRAKYRPRTDLFELYWADEVPGTQVGQVLSWLRSILFRRPGTVDRPLRPLAYLSWFTLILAGASLVALLLTIGIDGFGHLVNAASALAQIAWISTGLSVVSAAVSGLLISTLGNAARYLDATPDNIDVRQTIRQRGLDLLNRLHTEGGYDRIAIVGHALGSIIGYDIIRLYWAQVHCEHGSAATVSQTALKAFKKLLDDSAASGVDVTAYRRAQRDLWREYRRHGQPWLITDLITIGSPLTHAGTLLARSPGDLEALISDLELPSCPPRGTSRDLTFRETYLVDGEIRSLEVLPHAAPFAVTRWTNIYAPVRALVAGDPVGGPLAPIFGCGIKDVPVRITPWWRGRTPLAHASYWRRKPGSAQSAAAQTLREAIDLESGHWLNDHVAEMPWPMSVGPDSA